MGTRTSRKFQGYGAALLEGEITVIHNDGTYTTTWSDGATTRSTHAVTERAVKLALLRTTAAEGHPPTANLTSAVDRDTDTHPHPPPPPLCHSPTGRPVRTRHPTTASRSGCLYRAGSLDTGKESFTGRSRRSIKTAGTP